MAVTTTNEKLALIAWMQPWQLPLPISADGLGTADRQQLLWGYPGIAWAAPAIVIARVAIFGVFTIEPRIGATAFTLNEDS